MSDTLETPSPEPAEEKRSKFIAFLSENAVGLFTFLASVISVFATWRTQMLVDRSAHAATVTEEFVKNVTPMTAFFKSNSRVDEEAADINLTALEDIAQTPDDQIAILTIAARMLNPTACRSNGEATARFVTALISRLKLEGGHDSDLVLRFVRSRGFLNLASSDITTVYYNDDAIQQNVDFCSDKPAPSPSPAAARPATAMQPQPAPTADPAAVELSHRGVTPRNDEAAPQPSLAAARAATAMQPQPAPTADPAAVELSHRRATPNDGDGRNHATYWGEQTAWNDSKNDLFRELRPEGYKGWIHIATWERADACVDASGNALKLSHTECGATIRVNYSSTVFSYRSGDRSILAQPFWLGRARYLRDAAPKIYVHPANSAMKQRGSLGHVIGVVDYGECVSADDVRYYDVAPNTDRSFVHVWAHVSAAPGHACDAASENE